MFESYVVNDLLVGELVTVSNYGWTHGPNLVCEGPYIFYRTMEDKYIEVFTETEYVYRRPSNSTTRENYRVSPNVEENEFGKTYINETVSILNYLTEEEKSELKENPDLSLNKKRILEIYKNMVIKSNNEEKLEENLEKQYIKKQGK